MNSSYAVENASERQRLYSLTTNLNDDALKLRLKNGWTVAVALIDIAFWDQYYLALVKVWEKGGVTPVAVNADAINEAVHFISLSIPPRAAIQLVQTAALAVDRKVQEITPELAAQIEKNGQVHALRRGIHRRELLDEIEQVLRGR